MPLIDAATIETLKELDPDPEFLRSLIDSFEKAAVEKAQLLRSAMQLRAHSETAEIAHFMKSSSAGLGMIALSSLFAELESQAVTARVALSYSEIDSCLQSSLQELLQLRP